MTAPLQGDRLIETLINGKPSISVSHNDRGFLYGDGHFTTIAVIGRKPLFLSQHLERLQRDGERLGLTANLNDLEKEVYTLADVPSPCIIRCTITRGTGPRGYRYEAQCSSTRVVSRYPYIPNPTHTEGVSARICETRLSCQPRLAGIKHLNRLEQVLARSEWDNPDIAEGIMLDMQGHIIEGTMSNIFLGVNDSTLVTPDLRLAGVRGVMRGLVLQWCKELQLEVKEQPVTLQMLEQAREVFFTNSAIGIWPVICCETRSYAVGSLTRKLQDYLAEQIHKTQ